MRRVPTGALLLLSLTSVIAGCSSRSGGRADGSRMDGTILDGGGTSADAGTSSDGDAGDRDGGTDFASDGALASCVDPIDVAFVVDVSTSMRDEVEAIRTGMASIWEAANELTDDTRFSLVVFVDDVAVVDDCAPFDDLEAFQEEFARWREFTSTNAQPGGARRSNGDCPENSLDALHAAATECGWRAEATKIAIHATDDTFAERPERLSGVSVQHTYGEVLEALVDNEVRVGAFAAPEPEYCGAGRSANTAQGFFEPYEGMPALPEETGGRAWSIREVRAGELDMAAAINDLIEDEHCAPF